MRIEFLTPFADNPLVKQTVQTKNRHEIIIITMIEKTKNNRKKEIKHTHKMTDSY